MNVVLTGKRRNYVSPISMCFFMSRVF
ncbi:DUF3667 domain-containing protein (plasmid) [Vibrio parahaemolyticus]|nr:DUF3667 domain-containing protein [Vibrio parahaemolyticus]